MKILPTTSTSTTRQTGRRKFRHARSVAALAAAALSLGGIAAVAPAEATLAKNYIQPVYIIPADAPKGGDPQATIYASHQMVQKKWAEWGWTTRLAPSVRTVRTNRTCADFTGHDKQIDRVFENIHKTLVEEFGEEPNVIRTTFVKCSDTGWAAHGGGSDVFFYDGVVRSMDEQGRTGRFISENPGVISHEVGHTFGLPHEQCSADDTNTADLQSKGYPGGVSHSVMCTTVWPNPSPPQEYQRKLAFESRCDWILECSGSGGYQPTGTQPTPKLTASTKPTPDTPEKPEPKPKPIADKPSPELTRWLTWLFMYLVSRYYGIQG